MSESKKSVYCLLLLEDNLQDAGIIRAHIGAMAGQYEVVHTTARRPFEEELARRAYDLIICDFNLPNFNGFTALQLVKEKYPETPVIIVSGSMDNEQAVECLKRGATDFLFKERLERLPSAILRALQEVAQLRHRQQAERARQTSDLRYRTLFDYAPDGIVIADPESYYIDANASMCRMLGYTLEEFIGLHASNIVTSTEVVHIDPALTAIKAKSNYHREWQFRRKDGTVFPAEVIATQMPDGNLLGLIRDITERKKSEKQIAVFSNLGHQLNSANTAKEAARIIIENTDQLLSLDSCAFNLYSPEKQQVFPVYVLDVMAGQRTEVPFASSWFPPTPMIQKTVESGGQLILRDDLSAPAAAFEPFGNTTRRSASLMYVPMRHEQNVVGVLSVQSYTPNAYDAADLQALQALADYCAGALERIQDREALKQRVSELERFHRVTVGREMQMIELKDEVNQLAQKLGQPMPYRPQTAAIS